MSITWAIPASRFRQDFILKFLREAKGSSRPVEVRLFVPHRLYGRKPVGSRRWEARADLASTAKEIAKYVAEHEPAEAKIVMPDEPQ
jgi:hypothetical protein